MEEASVASTDLFFFSFLLFSAFYTFCDANVSLKRAKGVTMQQDETKASLALSSCSPER
jgi:hypothetical protein